MTLQETITYIPEVPVDMLDIDVDTKPSKQLVDSVKQLGVAVPIVVVASKITYNEKRYRVVDGRRRVAAARDALLKEVPALVITDDVTSDDEHALSVILNTIRSNNEAQSAIAIKSLSRTMSIEDVASAVGVTTSKAKRLAEFTVLDDEVLIDWAEGKVSGGVAKQLAKATAEERRKITDIARANEKWPTIAEVDDYLRLGRPTQEELLEGFDFTPEQTNTLTPEATFDKIRDLLVPLAMSGFPAGEIWKGLRRAVSQTIFMSDAAIAEAEEAAPVVEEW